MSVETAKMAPVVASTTPQPLSLLPLPSIQMARGLSGTANFLEALNTMTAFDLFRIQLESGSTEAATDAMKRLGVVCQAVGPVDTKNIVLPYLTRLVLQQQATPAPAQPSTSATSGVPANPPGAAQPAIATNASTAPTVTTATEATAAVTASSPSTPITSAASPLANVLLSDELLLLLGQQLLDVNAVLSGEQDLFLPLLERLASVEETVVRDQAVTALTALCEQKAIEVTAASYTSTVPPDNYYNISLWMALLKRLASADWFTAKVSACGIVAPIFALVNATSPSTATIGSSYTVPEGENITDSASASSPSNTVGSPTESSNITTNAATPQQNHYYESLLSTYKELCMDETPMVRRAAAKNFGFVLKHSGWNHREFGAALLGPILCRDEQDSVRLLAVSSLKDAGPIFGKTNPQWTIKHWLPIVRDGSTDMSWRVRNNLAKHFSDVVSTLGIQHDRRFHAEQSLVMACFVAMLTDAEAEVRAAAVTHLAKMVAWGGQAHFTTHLQPLLPALADDVVMEVRSKCAYALMVAARGGTLDDAVVIQAFGPLLESFLSDEFHEVQLQVLSNLHTIAHLLPGLPGVVSALLQMSKATNWRVREAVAKLLPHLAEARGLEFFSTVLLEPAWLTLLLDPVASVRTSIVRGMALLVRVAGQEWLVSNLLPHHIRIYNQNTNTYLVRITILNGHIQTAIQCQYGGVLWNDVVLQIVQRGLVDKVPNVRMVAAKGLREIIRATNEPPKIASSSGEIIDGEVTSGVDSTGAGLGAITEDTIAILQTQIRPGLERRIQEEEDIDVRFACQQAFDQLNSL